jgi:hypothetical protein
MEILAALPQHTAVSLRLTVKEPFDFCVEAEPRRRRRSLLYDCVSVPVRQSLTAMCCGKSRQDTSRLWVIRTY